LKEDGLAGDRSGPLSLKQRLLRHFPPGQFGRYLVVGVCNTVFGYSVYAGLTLLFTPHLPFPYLFASVISSIANISFSYLNYKFFIFRTKGNYFRELVRCFVVYGGAMSAGVFLLPPTIYLVRLLSAADKSAPYIAGALITGATVVAGFLAHKNFSFVVPVVPAGKIDRQK